MIDLVVPNDNEEKLIAIAEKLGFTSLCLAYGRVDSEIVKKIDGLKKKAKIKIYTASLDSSNSDIVFGDVSKDDINMLVENRKIDGLFGFESLRLKDKLKQRSSGLDPVLCKMMSDKKKIYCIDFSSILDNKDGRPVVLARLKQNLMLCRKFKVEVAVASFARSAFKMRNPLDVLGFLGAMGLDEGKKPFDAIEKRIVFNSKKKEGKIIMEGVERD